MAIDHPNHPELPHTCVGRARRPCLEVHWGKLRSPRWVTRAPKQIGPSNGGCHSPQLTTEKINHSPSVRCFAIHCKQLSHGSRPFHLSVYQIRQYWRLISPMFLSFQRNDHPSCEMIHCSCWCIWVGYPLVTKRGNGKFAINGGLNGKIIYKQWISNCYVWLWGHRKDSKLISRILNQQKGI